MKYILSLILTISFWAALNAQIYIPIEDESSFRLKIASISDQTMTLSSDFIQKKNISFISEPIITKGRFRFKRDNLLRWEYNDPFNYIMIINNGKILIDDEGNTNEVDMSKSQMFKEINTIMSNALLGKVLDDPDQFSSEISESNDYYRIKLIPIEKRMKEYLSEIHVFFDKDHFMVAKVIMYEVSDDSTEITFYNREINNLIDNAEFLIN